MGLLNAYGSTVGDNLEHHTLAARILDLGHNLQHLWNFNRQAPDLIRGCAGLVVGGGGLLWKGSNLRDWFFINTIMLARRCVGISLGYNQVEPLSPRWVTAVNRMEFITARDPWTLKWLKEKTGARAVLAPSVTWLYEPLKTEQLPEYDLGLILNRGALEINLGYSHPYKLFPGLKGLKVLEIPFAQPVEQPWLPAVSNPKKVAAIACREIRRCRAVWTGRLHGFILALLAGRPALCHGNGFKISGQAEMCNYPLVKPLSTWKGLKTHEWRDLTIMADELPLCTYVRRMRGRAKVHTKRLDAWLKTL